MFITGSFALLVVPFKTNGVPGRAEAGWLAAGWIIIGAVIFWFLVLCRRWHVEYDNIVAAIHRTILAGDTDVGLTFARMLRRKKDRKHTAIGDYINIWGTEFWTVIVALGMQFLVAARMLLFADPDCLHWAYTFLALVALSEVILYFVYLKWREHKVWDRPKILSGWFLVRRED